MSTSRSTFDQVKSILGKLDRSIDAARARRLDTGSAPSHSDVLNAQTAGTTSQNGSASFGPGRAIAAPHGGNA